MKSKFIKLLLLVLAVTLSLGLFTACGGDNAHEHDFSILKYDFSGHWYECSCLEKTEVEKHKGGEATCATQAECEVCNLPYGDVLPHSYSATVTPPTCTERGYTTYTCTCGYSYKSTYVEPVHDYTTAVVTEPTCEQMGYTTYYCECGEYIVDDYVDALYHDFSDWIESPEGALYKVCSRDETHVLYKSAEDDELAVLYSADDKQLDLVTLKRALNELGTTINTLFDIEGYIVNGERVDVLDLEVIISNTAGTFVNNYGHDRMVAIPQTVTVVINGQEYVLDSVYAYSKIIDEAEDLKFFTMDNIRTRNAIYGYYIVTKDIDANNLVLDEHDFESGKVYPGNGYSVDVGFKGVLDGRGHTIDGLSTKSCGLFGNTNAPVIKNIAFTNVSLSGYYATLFAMTQTRGKNPDNSFNGYEGLYSNIYISIKSISPGSSGRVGILANNVLPAATTLRNVVIEYLNVTSDIQTYIDNNNHFYMFGSSTYSMAGSTSTYKDCYAITTAPVLQSKKMPGFAENQLEFTLVEAEFGYRVDTVGAILDNQVKTIINRNGLTLSADHVLVGLRVYDNYEEMTKDIYSNIESLATFDTKYWTIVNGVPTWKIKG